MTVWKSIGRYREIYRWVCPECRVRLGGADEDWERADQDEIEDAIREAREAVSDAPDDTGAMGFSADEDERANAFLRSHGWRDSHRDYPAKPKGETSE